MKSKPHAAVVENAVTTSTKHVEIHPFANVNAPCEPECFIEQELSLDNNIEFLEPPSLSVNFQESFVTTRTEHVEINRSADWNVPCELGCIGN